jgi:putative endonuclease
MFKLGRKKADSHKALGAWGETFAEKRLKKKGYKSLTRNYSCASGEIDLIMVGPDQTLVFVEVKARANEDFGPAEAVITYAKKRRLTRAAHFFMATYNINDRPLRFDVIIIIREKGTKCQLRHYENVFVP